jgi:hypothetical protein
VPPVVVLVGTLDTKGHEYAFLRDRIREAGADVLMVDTGVLGEPQVQADVSREEVAREAGADHADLVSAADRGPGRRRDGARRGRRALAAALRRAACRGGRGRGIGQLLDRRGGDARPARRGAQAHRLDRRVGDTRPYVGATDVTMMYSVVDISGINRISAQILSNAAGAIAGMAGAAPPAASGEKPLVGATMFGVTTACVTRARERLEELGYEVLVFHATGTGGQSFEALATGGFLAGVLDATTTELADELVGGVLSAGPDRWRRSVARAFRRSSRSGRWTWSTSARATPSPRVRGPHALRPQPDDHPHAHDARRSAPSSCAGSRAKLSSRPGGRAVRAVATASR